MEFLYKLVPFDGLFNFNDTTLTAYWVLATLLIFIYSSYSLTKLINLIKRDLQNLNSDFNIDRINNIALKNSLTNYINNLIELDGVRKSKAKAIEYIDTLRLLENQNNYRLLHSIPNVLVGFGILGTFVGLAFGIADFRTENTDEIQMSIKNLLSGMSTAFISSIWGMSLSLIYSYLEKRKSNSLSQKVDEFCNNLDQKYLFNAIELRKLELIQSQEILNKYFTTKDDNNNQVYVGNIIRDLYVESQKQSTALQSFATDLAIKIEAGFETILSNQFNNNILPILNEISENIKSLLTNIKNPISDLTENLISDLKKSLENILQGFQNSITQSTTDNLEKLSNVLANTVEGIKDLPKSLTEEIQNIKTVIDTLNSTTLGTTDNLKSIIQAVETNNNYQVQLTNDLIKKLNNTIDRVNSTTNNILQIHNSFTNTLQKFDNFSNSFETTSENLLTNISSLTNVISKQTASLTELYSMNEKMIAETTEIMRNFADQFKLINSGLRSIFEEINEGLISYSNAVAENVQEILKVFTEEITLANERLSGSASKIEDILNELNDNFEKYFSNNQEL